MVAFSLDVKDFVGFHEWLEGFMLSKICLLIIETAQEMRGCTK